jgi:hypothetical protein
MTLETRNKEPCPNMEPCHNMEPCPLERRSGGRGGQGDASRGGSSSDRRSNPALAAVVDEAIRFDAERGAALAWAFLARHGVPPEMILRVLAAPGTGQRPRRPASPSSPASHHGATPWH